MNLYHILRRFNSCTSEVANILPLAISVKNSDYRIFNACSAYAIIRLHDLWASHCRQLVIYSCNAGFMTLSGIRLPRAASLSTKSNPVEWLRHNWSSTRKMDRSWEPDWHIPDQCLRAAKLLRIGNYNTVFNALSAITIIDQIRLTRNAIVHSHRFTYSRFRTLSSFLGLPRNISPVEIIYNRKNGTGPLLFDYWISELRLCLAAAVR